MQKTENLKSIKSHLGINIFTLAWKYTRNEWNSCKTHSKRVEFSLETSKFGTFAFSFSFTLSLTLGVGIASLYVAWNTLETGGED